MRLNCILVGQEYYGTKLTAIEIINGPNKTTYYETDTVLELSGLTFKAYYRTPNETITSEELSWSSNPTKTEVTLDTENGQLIVAYTDTGVTVTDTYPVYYCWTDVSSSSENYFYGEDCTYAIQPCRIYGGGSITYFDEITLQKKLTTNNYTFEDITDGYYNCTAEQTISTDNNQEMWTITLKEKVYPNQITAPVQTSTVAYTGYSCSLDNVANFSSLAEGTYTLVESLDGTVSGYSQIDAGTYNLTFQPAVGYYWTYNNTNYYSGNSFNTTFVISQSTINVSYYPENYGYQLLSPTTDLSIKCGADAGDLLSPSTLRSLTWTYTHSNESFKNDNPAQIDVDDVGGFNVIFEHTNLPDIESGFDTVTMVGTNSSGTTVTVNLKIYYWTWGETAGTASGNWWNALSYYLWHDCSASDTSLNVGLEKQITDEAGCHLIEIGLTKELELYLMFQLDSVPDTGGGWVVDYPKETTYNESDLCSLCTTFCDTYLTGIGVQDSSLVTFEVPYRATIDEDDLGTLEQQAWIPSSFEMNCSSVGANIEREIRTSYYVDNTSRIKGQGYWTRSKDGNDQSLYIASDGSAQSAQTGEKYAVLPAFAIKGSDYNG